MGSVYEPDAHTRMRGTERKIERLERRFYQGISWAGCSLGGAGTQTAGTPFLIGTGALFGTNDEDNWGEEVHADGLTSQTGGLFYAIASAGCSNPGSRRIELEIRCAHFDREDDSFIGIQGALWQMKRASPDMNDTPNAEYWDPPWAHTMALFHLGSAGDTYLRFIVKGLIITTGSDTVNGQHLSVFRIFDTAGAFGGSDHSAAWGDEFTYP